MQVTAHVQDCLDKGARALVGGAPHKELNASGGTFFNPTVLVDVTRDMLPFAEETFGPVAALLKFSTEEEAIEIANDTR
jgi:succinate-semialdehyde dehydrogenase/glutarate-semialdehyde dehydrogenase